MKRFKAYKEILCLGVQASILDDLPSPIEYSVPKRTWEAAAFAARSRACGDRLGGTSSRITPSQASTFPSHKPEDSRVERREALALADALSQQMKEEMVEQAVSDLAVLPGEAVTDDTWQV